jgi:hypothetical protein
MERSLTPEQGQKPMYLRIFSLSAALACIAACSPGEAMPQGDTIDCAIGGAADFSDDCVLERVGEAPDFVIHHPGGGFRRFVQDSETGEITVSDGAEPLAIFSEDETRLGLQVIDDRYLVPLDKLAALSK